MRIGTAYAQMNALDSLNEHQTRMLDAQQQLSSGKRINRPSDDPTAAAEAERLRSREARLDAEKRSVGYARTMLSSADSALGEATELLQSAREVLIASGTGTASPKDRAAYAEQLKQLRAQLLTVANRGDGAGGYIFGGQGTTTVPIDASGTVFNAPAGTQTVGQQQPGPITLDGRANFTAIPAPGGTESIFARLDTAISTLSNPATTSQGASAIVSTTIDAVDRAIDRFGLTRTVVGERLKGLDAHEQSLDGDDLQQQSRLSALVDVDFATAVSTLSQQQVTMEAALKSYAQVARMSLFQYL